jgi:hypothetical protein
MQKLQGSAPCRCKMIFFGTIYAKTAYTGERPLINEISITFFDPM